MLIFLDTVDKGFNGRCALAFAHVVKLAIRENRLVTPIWCIVVFADHINSTFPLICSWIMLVKFLTEIDMLILFLYFFSRRSKHSCWSVL